MRDKFLKFQGGSARRGFTPVKFWLWVAASASDRSLRFCTSSRADCGQNRIAKLDESLKKRIKQGYG
ncbi:hypothetical protein [uncultured Campylobacter sp.]|uniref:hypothetical protein n=1 Tax=uncultured Campylobacter sp. TaxID=218934 RepID=UPI00260D8C4D|nr:hypothetical protein [uncultured Campylobacter sp.]